MGLSSSNYSAAAYSAQGCAIMPLTSHYLTNRPRSNPKAQVQPDYSTLLTCIRRKAGINSFPKWLDVLQS